MISSISSTSRLEYIVDEKTIIDFFCGKTELFHLFDDPSKVALSVVTAAELYRYAQICKSSERNTLAISKDFCNQLQQIPVTSELCELFAQLKIKTGSTAVSDNKIWIAATAYFYHLTLISEDKDFDCFDGLLRKDLTKQDFI